MTKSTGVKELFYLFSHQFEPNGLIDTIQRKGNHSIGSDIGAISEAFSIAATILLETNSLDRFDTLSFKNSIYLTNDNKLVVFMEFHEEELQYTAHWLANSINSSSTLKALKGTFCFFLEPLGSVYIPHIYTYIFPDNRVENVFPILSLNYLEDSRDGIEWVEDAMNYINSALGIEVDFEKFNVDPIVKLPD